MFFKKRKPKVLNETNTIKFADFQKMIKEKHLQTTGYTKVFIVAVESRSISGSVHVKSNTDFTIKVKGYVFTQEDAKIAKGALIDKRGKLFYAV